MRLLSALSLMLVAFAHQPLDLRGSSLPDASAYALPGRVDPGHLRHAASDKGDAHVTHGMPCGACLVAGSILVPTPAEIPGPSFELAHAIVSMRRQRC